MTFAKSPQIPLRSEADKPPGGLIPDYPRITPGEITRSPLSFRLPADKSAGSWLMVFVALAEEGVTRRQEEGGHKGPCSFLMFTSAHLCQPFTYLSLHYFPHTVFFFILGFLSFFFFFFLKTSYLTFPFPFYF